MGCFFNMKDVHIDVPYISMQFNLKNSPIAFYKTWCETMKIDFKNSPEMEFSFFEVEIWCAWLKMDKNWVLIMQDKKLQFSFYTMQ